jgi:site-specific DNA-methyltransferase (adenine-specific)
MYDVRGNRFLLGDCFDRMREIADGSVDMVLADLPYGTTACAWDSVLPFDALWAEYWRVCKPGAAVVLTASQPFTSALVMSQVQYFKYALVWEKERPSNPLLANKQILKYHEDICIFYRKAPTFHPQMRERKTENKRKNAPRPMVSGVWGKTKPYSEMSQTGESDLIKPRSILPFAMQRGQHPTQKPVALFEYLIRTYTNPDALVLDNTAGSGTTAIAALNTDRRFICIEREPGYYWPAVARVMDATARVQA